jgi:hypothetical protein
MNETKTAPDPDKKRGSSNNPLLTSYYTAIVSEVRLGVPKSESRFSEEAGFNEAWDEIESFISEYPDAIIEIPGELS